MTGSLGDEALELSSDGLRQRCIGDFFELRPGYAFKSSEFLESGIPVIKIKNVKAGHFSDHQFSFVSPSFLMSRKDRLAQYGDLLISMSGNRHDGSPETWVGKVAFFDKKAPHFINQRVAALRPKRGVEINSRYAAFALSALPYQQLFISIATSSGGQANLSPQQVLSAPFSPPPLNVQSKIAQLLGALDDKVELNRKMNATLEAVAQAVFKSWFVDFDPVRAKAEGHDTGLPPEAAALFPESFEASELGEIPTGWRAGPLGEVAVNKRLGVSHRDIPENTPYIGLEHMPRRSIALERWGYAENLESNKSKFQRGDILFGKLRPYFHKVGVAPLSGVCSTDILVATAASSEWFGFVLMHLCSDALVAHTDRCSTGTKMPRASWEHISRYEVTLPPTSVAALFTSLISPMVDRIVAAIFESCTLSTIHDALLPKLISGEVRVGEAGRIVERTA